MRNGAEGLGGEWVEGLPCAPEGKSDEQRFFFHKNVVSIIKTHSCDLSPLNFSVLIQFFLKCIPITHRGVNKICSAWEKPFRNACYEKYINLSLSFCLEEVLINEALKLTSALGDLVGQ